MIAVIPIRAFTGAKTRLAAHGSAVDVSALVQAMAGHVVSAVGAAGLTAVVVSSDETVREWATEIGVATEDDPGSLDGAAALAPALADDSPWLVAHADMPLLAAADIAAVLGAAISEGTAIAPSRDGGSNLVAGVGAFPFAYGPGSFHRHLGSRPRSRVVVRLGTLLDVDRPRDLTVAAGLSRGLWLRAHLGAT